MSASAAVDNPRAVLDKLLAGLTQPVANALTAQSSPSNAPTRLPTQLPVPSLSSQTQSPSPTQLSELTALRAQALARAQTLALPSTHDEAWRFTPLTALTQHSFSPVNSPTTLQAADLAPWQLSPDATQLVFVDGVYAPQLSHRGADAMDAVFTLQTAAPAHGPSIAAHLGQHAHFYDALFPALNTALMQDAAVLLVPPNTALAAPVHLLFVSTQADVASQPRVLLVAGRGSALTVVEDYVALHEGAYLTNTVAELVLADNARLEHIRVQRESVQAFHMASCAVSLGQGSHYHGVNIAMGAQISRLDCQALQTAQDTECLLDGLALISGQQLADTHSFIDHAKPHGTSRQLHKCIVDGAAHAVFNGQVMVRPGAQATDSAQSSRNLLLSKQAVVDTQPQLEIFADDVKCTHGATVGQLDSEEVFYLQSRGLPAAQARNLLTYAFAAEVIDRIPVASLRQQLTQTVLDRTMTPS